MSSTSPTMTASGRLGNVEIAATPSPDGLVELTAFSASLNRRADLSLYAPRGWEDDLELPLVTLLHGVYGSHWAWARNGLAHMTLQSLVDRGQIRPVVLAMPSDGLIGIGSGYTSRPGADAQSWILDEVPELARYRYPRVGLTGMAIAGLSMGGWGALRLAAYRPRQYQAAVGMSPITRWDDVAGYASEQQRSDHSYPIEDPDLADLLVARRAGLPPLRITCGSNDALAEDVRTLHRVLESAGVEHEYAETEGGHEWSVWVRELASSLIFIDRAWRRSQPSQREQT
jgi:putative tributyrin esterase